MSQEKVDRYKKEKANRKQAVARERRNRYLSRIIIIAVIMASQGPTMTYINTEPITDYMNSLDAAE